MLIIMGSTEIIERQIVIHLIIKEYHTDLIQMDVDFFSKHLFRVKLPY